MPSGQSDNRERLLDAAQELCQTRGYNGFSYRDLAEIVGITTASIHYHFPSKAELGVALVRRYRERMNGALDEVGRTALGSAAKLDRYMAIFHGSIKAGLRMCLGGMLANEYSTLPGELQIEVRKFFDANERWLASLLEKGRSEGELRFAGSSMAAATSIMATLEGAMMGARAFRDESRFAETIGWIKENFAQVS